MSQKLSELFENYLAKKKYEKACNTSRIKRLMSLMIENTTHWYACLSKKSSKDLKACALKQSAKSPLMHCWVAC